MTPAAKRELFREACDRARQMQREGFPADEGAYALIAFLASILADDLPETE